jgi:hypothetical protein
LNCGTLAERVQLKSPVRENCTPGFVRGASSNRRLYRDGGDVIENKRKEQVNIDQRKIMMVSKYRVISQQDTIDYMFMDNHPWNSSCWHVFFKNLIRTDEEERQILARELSKHGLSVFDKWEREYRKWIRGTVVNQAECEAVLSMYLNLVQQFGSEAIETALIFFAKADRELSGRFVDEFLSKYGAHAEQILSKGLSSGDVETRSAILYHLFRRVQEGKANEENWEAAFARFQQEGTQVVEETVYSVLATFIFRKLRHMGAPEERVASLISQKSRYVAGENMGIFESALEQKDATAERILEVMLAALEQADWPRWTYKSGGRYNSYWLVEILMSLATRGNQRVCQAIKEKIKSGDLYTKMLLISYLRNREEFADRSTVRNVLLEAFRSDDRDIWWMAIDVLEEELIGEITTPTALSTFTTYYAKKEEFDYYFDECALIPLIECLHRNSSAARLLSAMAVSGRLSDEQKALIKSKENTLIDEEDKVEVERDEGHLVTERWTEQEYLSDYSCPVFTIEEVEAEIKRRKEATEKNIREMSGGCLGCALPIFAVIVVPVLAILMLTQLRL